MLPIPGWHTAVVLDEGKTWSAPMVLAEDIENGYCSSGGWHATADTLVAYINTWPDNLSPKGGYTRYITSTDGINWSAPADVTMADGARIEGIFEQDPHVLPNGRIVNAMHKQPGTESDAYLYRRSSGSERVERGCFHLYRQRANSHVNWNRVFIGNLTVHWS